MKQDLREMEDCGIERQEQGTGPDDDIDSQIASLIEGSPEKKKRFRKGAFRAFWKGSSRKRKGILILAGVVFAFLLLSKCGGRKNAGEIPVSVTELSLQPIREVLTVSGPVSGTDSVDVVSNLHAEILELYVKEGDQVEKGQVLARLDRTDLEREVETARNAYQLAVTNEEQQDKTQALEYQKAVQDLEKAQADYDRNVVLYNGGYLSQTEMEQFANGVNDAKRHKDSFTLVDGHGAAEPSYELQVKNAQLELEKKQKELEDTEIKSTISGTVVRVNSKVGQFADKVEDDKPILSIENLDQLEMQVRISEYSIGKVQVGQKVRISADILNGETAEGEIVKISPTGEEKGNGSTERVVPATIRIDGNDTKLIAGITAKAEILIQESQSALVIPVSALIDNETGTFVAVAENGHARLIPVETGIDGDLNVEVKAASEAELSEGMQVITNPSPELADGSPVAIR